MLIYKIFNKKYLLFIKIIENSYNIIEINNLIDFFMSNNNFICLKICKKINKKCNINK